MCRGILAKYPTQEQVKAVLDYDPDTGIFTWKENPFLEGKWKLLQKTRFAGKQAGTVSSSGTKKYVRINCRVLLTHPMHAHRLACIYMIGYAPEHVDHINGNGTDNRWCNLRLSDSKDNSKNVRKASNNTSGFTGVSKLKGRDVWRAYIKINQKTIWLGRFSSLEAAAKARSDANKLFEFRDGHGSDRPLY